MAQRDEEHREDLSRRPPPNVREHKGVVGLEGGRTVSYVLRMAGGISAVEFDATGLTNAEVEHIDERARNFSCAAFIREDAAARRARS